MPPDEPFVVKPAISAGGRKLRALRPADAEAARELVARIHAAGRTAMVQPFLGEHEENRARLHRRRVLACAPPPRAAAGRRSARRVLPGRGTRARPRRPRRTRRVAEAALPDGLLYGRVDLMGGLVLELEIAEPSLYLTYADGRRERFAAAIVLRLASV
jgi:glutathione synthase/RimK-type ligase-like ATP-grasp enzyme